MVFLWFSHQKMAKSLAGPPPRCAAGPVCGRAPGLSGSRLLGVNNPYETRGSDVFWGYGLAGLPRFTTTCLLQKSSCGKDNQPQIRENGLVHAAGPSCDILWHPLASGTAGGSYPILSYLSWCRGFQMGNPCWFVEVSDHQQRGMASRICSQFTQKIWLFLSYETTWSSGQRKPISLEKSFIWSPSIHFVTIMLNSEVVVSLLQSIEKNTRWIFVIPT